MPAMPFHRQSPTNAASPVRGPGGIAARAAIVIAAAAIAGTIHADVYKCAGDGRSPIYQEMPCAAGKELRNFQTDPPEITVLPGSPKGGASSGRTTEPANRDGRPEKAAKTGKPDKAKGDASERRHVHSGMTEGEVLARLGTPDVTSRGKNQKQARWTWLPADGDPETVTIVVLVDGVVTEVERKTVKK
jgi:hypothetical protein